MFLAEHITNGVVLLRKHRMQHLHPDPPIAIEARQYVSVSIARQELLPAFLAKFKFPVWMPVSQGLGDSFGGPIDLREIPPSGIGVLVSRTF